MAKKTIFISYDYDYDKHWKNLLVAWDKNGEFDFTFYDASVDVSVNSTDAAAIKRVISARIKGATRFLCIVGKHTHKSAWVNWEIEKAVELKRKLIAVKTDAENTSPDAILGVGASWAMSFTFDAIKKAVDEA
jgi:hypothetical protein